MARYLGAKCKKCRQLSFSVCGSERCALARRPDPPGVHAPGRRKMSDYRKRLLEKQKLRFSYWLPERQFRRYVSRAFQQRGITGENLIRLLERRLDTLVYRLGFASNILAARQLVLHGHILVNGQSTDRPNYLARAGDEISVKERSRGIVPVRQGMELSLARPDIPYLAKDRKGFCGKLASIPMREEVPLSVNEGLVVEYYAKYI